MPLPVLPKAQSPIAGNLHPAGTWFDFFRDLRAFVVDNQGNTAVIDGLLERIQALEDAADVEAVVRGVSSVQTYGTLAEGLVQVLLVNDNNEPGNTYYYGTGPTAEKGWSTVASAFTATAAGIALTTGADGVTNITPDDDLAAVEALGSVGFAARTAANTWAQRTIEAVAGETTSTNENGVSGNPTIGLANVADAGGGTLQRTAFDVKGRKTGTSAATTDHLTEGATNLYHTAARVRATVLTGLSLASSAVIAATDTVLAALGQLQAQITALGGTVGGLVIDSIADSDTTHAPSRNAVFDALALKQDADTTLSALAAQNWAANAVPIGSGADTVAQVAFAANTFPARASAGNLVAKPITDFGLSLVDDADASAGRSTLGLGTAATQNTGTSGANVPLLNGNNTYSGTSSLTGQVSIIRAAATAQHLDPVLDGTGNAFKSFSDPTNAKEYIFDATTDSGNTAPSGGAVGVRFSVLGVSRWKIDDTGALFPNADDTYTVGKSTNRPSIVYTKDLDTQETVINGGILSPAQITANQDNYAPTGHSATHTFRLNTDAARSITGLAGGVKGRQIIIANIGGFNITLSHDVTSTAANRFLCPGSAAVVIRPNGWVMCFYDDTSSRWRVMGI